MLWWVLLSDGWVTSWNGHGGKIGCEKETDGGPWQDPDIWWWNDEVPICTHSPVFAAAKTFDVIHTSLSRKERFAEKERPSNRIRRTKTNDGRRRLQSYQLGGRKSNALGCDYVWRTLSTRPKPFHKVSPRGWTCGHTIQYLKYEKHKNHFYVESIDLLYMETLNDTLTAKEIFLRKRGRCCAEIYIFFLPL